MRFPTTGDRDVVLRKIVYDAYHNNFTSKAKKLEEEYRRRSKKPRRRSAPNTVCGKALTVGEQLEKIKIYGDSQQKKKQDKEQRAVVRENKKREAIIMENDDLREARWVSWLVWCWGDTDLDVVGRLTHTCHAWCDTGTFSVRAAVKTKQVSSSAKNT